MTMQRGSNLPDVGAKLQAFDQLDFTNGVTGIRTVHNLTSTILSLNDTPVSPWEAIYNLLSVVNAPGHPLLTVPPTSSVSAQTGYLPGSTIIDGLEVRQNLFDSYVRSPAGRGYYSNLLNHSANAAVKKFMELVQLGVRGNSLATEVNNAGGDFEMATIQDLARQNVWVLRRKSTGGSTTGRTGWQNLGHATATGADAVPNYNYYWTAAGSLEATGTIVRFRLYIGYEVENPVGTWTRTRLSLPNVSTGGIPGPGLSSSDRIPFPGSCLRAFLFLAAGRQPAL